MKRNMVIGLAAAAIVVVGGVGVAATMGGTKKAAFEFDTVKVERGDVARVVSASGAVQPLKKVDVGSEVSGMIVALNVDYNSKVSKDQILAVVDPSSFRSAVAQADAQLAQSIAQVATAKAAIQHSVVSLNETEKNWKRQKALFDQGAISQQVWEQADRDYQFAVVQLASDKVALQSAEAGQKRSQASLDDAKVKLAKTSIRAPIDGVIIDKAVNVGQTVQSSMSVAKFFTIAQDLSQIQIEAAVVESDIGGITVGDPASFSVDAFPGQRFQGEVSQVRSQGTEQANVVTYMVIITAQNPGGKLLPGMTANVEITAERAVNVLRLASEATRFQPPKELAEELGLTGPGGAPGAAPGGGGFGGAPGGGQAQRTGGQRGQGGFGNPVPDWLKEIGIDAARVTKISAELQEEMDKVRAAAPRPQTGGQPLGGGGGFGPPASLLAQQAMQDMRNKIQQASDGVLKRNLSGPEYEAYSKKRAEAQAQKRVVAYTLDAKGKLQRKMLVLGIADANFAQIIRGADEGDVFVSKAHPPTGKKPQPAATPAPTPAPAPTGAPGGRPS